MACCERVDAARFRTHRGTLVLDAQYLLSCGRCRSLTALTALIGWRALAQGGEVLPFFSAIGLFFLGYLGLAVSVFPYLVPPSLTIWQTASSPSTQTFMLIGTLGAAADHFRLRRVRLLVVPRQGARRRELSLSSVTSRSLAAALPATAIAGGSCPSPCAGPAAAPAPCDRRPAAVPGTRSGKRCLMSGRRHAGGVVRRPDHNPAFRLDVVDRHPRRAFRRGVEQRLGRPDAPNATSAAVRGSPATVGAGVADPTLKTVAEKTRHRLRRLVDVEIDAEPRQRDRRQHGNHRRNEQEAEPGRDHGSAGD